MLMKNLRKLLYAVLIILLIGSVGFVGWATFSAQEATERAVTVLNDNSVKLEDGLLVFQPNFTTNRGFIYYPGGLVDPEAYAYTAQGIADAGYLVVVPKMPLNLAFMGINQADRIRTDHPEIDSWAIGGHSLGGAMAAEYTKNNLDSISGLIMYAAYPANYADFIDTPVPILTIIASNDPGSIKQEEFYDTISDSAMLVIIEGGNHRQYADYSFQNNDGIATISVKEQQDQIIAATIHFLVTLN